MNEISSTEKGKKPNEYAVVVNGAVVELDHERVSYEELGGLAYPGHDQEAMFTITYNHSASEPKKGVLVAGEAIEVKKNGTTVDVRLTTRS